MQPDADDTAKSILVLNLANQDVGPDGLLEHFETETHFKTYAQERDPSFSANCNVLAALLHVSEPAVYDKQIEKCSLFLCNDYLQSGSDVRDKWVSMSVFFRAYANSELEYITILPSHADGSSILHTTTALE